MSSQDSRGSAEDLGLPLCLVSSRALLVVRLLWMRGWARTRWLGASVTPSAEAAEPAAVVAFECRSKPIRRSIGAFHHRPNPPSALDQNIVGDADWALEAGAPNRPCRCSRHPIADKSTSSDAKMGAEERPERPAAPCLGWRQRCHQLSAPAAQLHRCSAACFADTAVTPNKTWSPQPFGLRFKMVVVEMQTTILLHCRGRLI